MDGRRRYAALFLEESLGLVGGCVEPDAVPTEFVDSLSAAMKGSEGSRSPEPRLEQSVQEVGADVIQSILDSRGWFVRKERWPQAAKYAVCLTHDVDSISRPLRHVLQRRSRFSTTDLLLALLGVRNLYDNITSVVDLESERKFHSSFYFLSGSYDLRARAAQLRSMSNEGWEVGLHGDFGTHDSPERLAEALSKLTEMTGIAARGVREHYLRFDYGTTWRIMEDANLMYDTTVGNSDTLGFRSGLCNPFHPPDEEWKPMRLLELPLVLMDTTLWGYLKATEEDGLKKFENLRRSVESVNGLFTLLWHPESLRMKGGRVYPRLLDEFVREGCYVATGLEVANWWQRRASPTFTDGKTLRMEDAPEGLVLRSRAKGGEAVAVKGASAELEGDSATIKAKGGPLEVVLA